MSSFIADDDQAASRPQTVRPALGEHLTQHGFATRQVHAAPLEDIAPVTPRATPIYLTAGFRFTDYDQATAHFGEGQGYAYTRYGNPTIEAVERRIAALEGGTDAILVASGQAAIAHAVLGVAAAGDRITSASSLYEGTRGLFLDNFPRLGIETDFVDDARDLDTWAAAITPRTRALFLESIPNPRNDLADLAAIADLAHDHGIPLIVDNTLATPYLLRPMEHGADIVIHSASKFLAGQGSVLGGVIVDNGRFDAGRSGALFPHLVSPTRLGGPSPADRFGGRARAGYIRETVVSRFGPTPSPWSAFQIGQGVETLSIRVARQSASALEIAAWLARQPEVASVDYCGLPSSPSYELAQRYLPDGQGSVFSFTLHGGHTAARAFIEAVELLTHMAHLGDVRSLILHPATTSHVQRSPHEQAAAGILPGTLRLAIGIEEVADLRTDLARGIAAARWAATGADGTFEPAASEPAASEYGTFDRSELAG